MVPESIIKEKTGSLFAIDWTLFVSACALAGIGLVTMNSFVGDAPFFSRQLIWLGIAVAVFFIFSVVDWRFLRRRDVVTTLFVVSVAVLALLLAVGGITRGVQSWFTFGIFSIQPADPIKLVLIIVLAKYFTRRHIEIKHIRHILLSGFYAFVLFALIFLQPDFGSAIIIACIWFGVVLIAGISKKHLALLGCAGLLAFGGLWGFVFQDYQKDRILSFLSPYTDLQGSGYNAFQSMVAVGSGQMFGKGVGYGTQSQLKFLPEYETDFIFAAFAEEWGFAGVLMVFTLYGIVIWHILSISSRGASNFEMLFGMGLAFLFMSHIAIHVGINIGLLPVTGTTLPFMSYGGSHLVTEFAGLGILMGMRKYSKPLRAHDVSDAGFQVASGE